MMVNIKLFATLRQAAGSSEIKMEIADDAVVQDIRAALMQLYPDHAEHFKLALAAINQRYAAETENIHKGDELAFFPPVSGGQEVPTICKLTKKALSVDTLVKNITLPTTGAVAVFTGTIRAKTRRGSFNDTIALTYDAYKTMALVKMQQIAQEIRERWQCVEGIAIVQRLGTMTPQTISVVIACSSPHRDEGVFEATRYGIDRLKEIVPIWKKEISSSGEVWVEGDYLPKAGE